MDSINLIVAAMLSLTPEQFRPADDTPKQATYEAIATDIYTAVHAPLVSTTNPNGELPFDGPMAVEATEAALTAIAANESSYDENVRSCKKKGDHGRSVSIFQILSGPGRGGKTETEVCENPVLAAQLAINILGWYKFSWKTEQVFAGYATGRGDTPNYASTKQHTSFVKLLKNSKIKITKKKGIAKLWAESSESEVVSSTNGSWLWTLSLAP